MQKRRIAIFFLCVLLFFYIFPLIVSSHNDGSISYQVHLKDIGWVDAKYNGDVAGTTGESRRMEAIQINLQGVDGILTYQVHVKDYGWLPKVSNGEITGTTGESRRMEAIIISLENSSYDIKYRVHVKDYGWLDWAKSGQVAGTTGECRRIEAIQIIIQKKNNISSVINSNISINEDNNTSNIENSNNIEDSNLTNKLFGIDVSKHQGAIDWKKVKTSGVEFAMIRCGYRGYTEGSIFEDIYFENNIRGAYNNGIKVGLYFYSSAINETEAIEEANYVLSLTNKYSIKGYISYPVAIDIEDFEGTRNNNLSVQERTGVVKAFCKIIKNNGFTPSVYSYTYFLENKLNMESLKEYDVWIADYYGNTWYNRPFTIWQYTDKGKIEGINRIC